MYLALDVHYKVLHAKTVGVLFDKTDNAPQDIIIEYTLEVAEYVPGQFYKRELPCLLQVIDKVDLNSIVAIIVDGHVYVDNELSPGLGAHLYKALREEVPVIGVAKKAFHANDKTVTPILRGQSKTPLYISAIGMAQDVAVSLIKDMHGPHRIPTLLKILDQHTKS